MSTIKIYIIDKNNGNNDNNNVIEEKILSYLLAVINVDECIVVGIETNENHRGFGYATKLIKSLKNLCKILKIKKITLDDCSDNFLKHNNIYLNNNFCYIHKNEPEMICYI